MMTEDPTCPVRWPFARFLNRVRRRRPGVRPTPELASLDGLIPRDDRTRDPP